MNTNYGDLFFLKPLCDNITQHLHCTIARRDI